MPINYTYVVGMYLFEYIFFLKWLLFYLTNTNNILLEMRISSFIFKYFYGYSSGIEQIYFSEDRF